MDLQTALSSSLPCSTEGSDIDDSTPSLNKSRPESDTSWSDTGEHENVATIPGMSTQTIAKGLFDANLFAKIYRTATDYLHKLQISPQMFPEIVPQKGESAGQWEFREADFWTCGFFPGTLYALLERMIKYPHMMGFEDGQTGLDLIQLRGQLRRLSEVWSQPLYGMTGRTDTHDLGFIVMPAMKRSWQLTGNTHSLDSIIKAAQSLATRYVAPARAIRSWDCLLKKDIVITDMGENLLVIIDSLCNLDLLFYASALSGDKSLADLATNHARTVLKTHLRPEAVQSAAKDGYRGQLYSTCHVANLDPSTGRLLSRYSAQGFSHGSTWSRGQAWAILGYAQSYMWTKDEEFLNAACGVAEYFLLRLQRSPAIVEANRTDIGSEDNRGVYDTIGRFTPLWDFDAPIDDASPLRDSSAGLIAANGMLILSQALMAINDTGLSNRFRRAALSIANDVVDFCVASETAKVFQGADGPEVTDVRTGHRFDAILKHGTANNNENARRRYADHGLVYSDYYLVEFGNRLLDLGFV
ncbi:unsaturated glucuronyl hydrolase [Mariannaea sp. PMI_226]|nr:unsaturated glucuronyl hydrolase [Mariannaea sp. PMI_226]